MAEEFQAGYHGAEVNPVWFREKISPREQFFSNAVVSILQVGLRLSRGATEHTLDKGDNSETNLRFTVLYLFNYTTLAKAVFVMRNISNVMNLLP